MMPSSACHLVITFLPDQLTSCEAVPPTQNSQLTRCSSSQGQGHQPSSPLDNPTPPSLPHNYLHKYTSSSEGREREDWRICRTDVGGGGGQSTSWSNAIGMLSVTTTLCPSPSGFYSTKQIMVHMRGEGLGNLNP